MFPVKLITPFVALAATIPEATKAQTGEWLPFVIFDGETCQYIDETPDFPLFVMEQRNNLSTCYRVTVQDKEFPGSSLATTANTGFTMDVFEDLDCQILAWHDPGEAACHSSGGVGGASSFIVHPPSS